MNRDRTVLDTHLETIFGAPRDQGPLEMVVARPDVGQREVLSRATLTPEGGLVGDSWGQRAKRRDDAQVTVMGVRVLRAIAGDDPQRWALAGDQLLVDLDLSVDNLPPGTQLRVGTAVLEITTLPHLGCGKFVDRFGRDAMNFVNAPEGRSARLRGVHARVIVGGEAAVGSIVEVDRS